MLTRPFDMEMVWQLGVNKTKKKEKRPTVYFLFFLNYSFSSFVSKVILVNILSNFSLNLIRRETTRVFLSARRKCQLLLSCCAVFVLPHSNTSLKL